MVTIRPQRGPEDPGPDRPDVIPVAASRTSAQETAPTRRSRRERREEGQQPLSAVVPAPTSVNHSYAAPSPSAPGTPPAAGLSSTAQSPSTTWSRALRAGTGRARLGPIPVASVVGLELVLLGAFFLWRRDGLILIALGAVALVLGALLVIPLSGSSVGGAMARRLGFALRRHVGAGGAEHTRVRGARDHHAQGIGVLESAPCVSIAVRLRARRDRLIVDSRPIPVPVRAVLGLARDAGIPLDSLVTLRRQTGDGTDGAEVLVVVRINPVQAADAILVRGGGRVGLDATMAALSAMVAHESARRGLEATVLTPDQLRHEVDGVLAGVAAQPTLWTEAWSDVTTGSVSHRTTEVLGLPARGRLQATPGPDHAVVAVRFAPTDGAVRARAFVRVSDAQAGGLAARATRAFAKASVGGRTRLATGHQRSAYLETTVIGSGATPAPDTSAGPAVQGWFDLPVPAVDRLVPWIEMGGIVLGTDRDGRQVALDLGESSPRRLLVIGDGQTASEIAAATARSGLPVAVVTDRPAPWNALARDPALQGLLTTVPPGTEGAPAIGPGQARPALVLVEGDPSEASTWRPSPTVLVLRANLDQVEADLPSRCSLTILAGSAASSTARAARVAGISEDALLAVAPEPHEVVLVEAGRVRVCRLASGG